MTSYDQSSEAVSFDLQELVAVVYRAALDREPDAKGLQDWSNALRVGRVTFEQYLRATVQSTEFKNRVKALVESGAIDYPPVPPIPDAHLYQPLFSPWRGYGEFVEFFKRAQGRTAVSRESAHVLYQVALQALHVEGEIWECGVYRGGTAAMLAEIIATKSRTPKRLRLFDTFQGMPETKAGVDLVKRGAFADTSLATVKDAVGHSEFVSYHQGFIPGSFAGLEGSRIALAHVDVDIFTSIQDCCEFIFPRLTQGGFIVFDDYGLPTCPGARKAVDDFFESTEVQPLVLPTAQAIVFQSAPAAVLLKNLGAT